MDFCATQRAASRWFWLRLERKEVGGNGYLSGSAWLRVLSPSGALGRHFVTQMMGPRHLADFFAFLMLGSRWFSFLDSATCFVHALSAARRSVSSSHFSSTHPPPSVHRSVVKRRVGAIGKEAGSGQPAKRRRTKAYQATMMLDNLLKHSTGFPLSHFRVQNAPDGQWAGDPWTWPLLTLAPDSGPDNVAMEHFLTCEVGSNIETTWDWSHSLNSAVKCALKAFSVGRGSVEVRG